ncbi:hypothetical protein [Methanocaldococcus sp.]
MVKRYRYKRCKAYRCKVYKKYNNIYRRYKGFIRMINIWMDRYELDDVIYEKIVKELDWRTLTPRIAYNIVRFLELWRVRNPPREPRDIKKLVNVIKSNSVQRYLNILKGKSLTTLNIDKYKKPIEYLYTELQNIKGVGPTAVTKILHLLNPHVFVMWDEKIRTHYGIKNENPTSEDYIKFMKKMKCLALKFLKYYARDNNIKNLEYAERKISKHHRNKPLSKLIDEYNWLTITKDMR